MDTSPVKNDVDYVGGQKSRMAVGMTVMVKLTRMCKNKKLSYRRDSA